MQTQKQTLMIVTVISLFLILLSTIIGVSIITSGVIGWGNNATTLTKVWVWNTPPNITSVIVQPSPIDLTPGNTTQVNCTAFIWDYNGYYDVNITNATFFHSDVNHDSADDNNNHYTANITDCNCSEGTGGTGTNLTCTCYFDVWYYAYNGTWICNMSVQDKAGNATQRQKYFNHTNNVTVTVNSVLGIRTPPELDYGNLSVTETSTVKSLNITNYGNLPINVSVRAYGGTSNDTENTNLSMICDYNNISVTSQRYSMYSDTNWTFAAPTYNTTQQIANLTLSIRTNDTEYGNDTNTTYWWLRVPLTVGGFCNGTLVFTAVDVS